MTRLANLPFTEKIIAAHPSLEQRNMGEVVLTSLTRMSPARRHKQTQAEAAQQQLDRAFTDKLRILADLKTTNVIQVGAHDGRSDDPLYEALNIRKWGAVLVEPTQLAFSALHSLRSERPSTTLINKAVTPSGEPVTLYSPLIANREVFGAVWTSTNRSQVEQEIKRNLGRHILRHTTIEKRTFNAISPTDLLGITGIRPENVDALVCDIEGQDPPVVEAFLDAGVRPKVLLFEHLHANPIASNALNHRLADEGYEVTVSIKDTLAFH